MLITLKNREQINLLALIFCLMCQFLIFICLELVSYFYYYLFCVCFNNKVPTHSCLPFHFAYFSRGSSKTFIISMVTDPP